MMWLSLLKSPRLWGVVAILAAVATTYNVGKSVAEGECAEQREEALTAQRDRLVKQHAETVSNLQADHRDALTRAEGNTRTVTRVEKEIEYVTREIKVPVGCDKLADDIVRVQREAADIIRAAGRRSGS